MMSLTLYLCRKNTFPGQMCCIFFSVSPRDREFPKTGHKMLAKWGIRLPNQFLSHNTLLQSKNQAKVAYFTKLMILIFWCPEEIRITNFTRMPLLIKRKFVKSFRLITKQHIFRNIAGDLFAQLRRKNWQMLQIRCKQHQILPHIHHIIISLHISPTHHIQRQNCDSSTYPPYP